jgi:hypothetical protein
MLGQIIMLLFGANSPGRSHQQIELIARFHLVGLALAAAGLAVGIATFCTRRADRVSQILVVGTLATAAAGVFSTLLPSLAYAHEVAILLPFGAVLAGRMLPPLLPARWRPGRVAVPALAAWLAAGLAALCFAATWAPMAPPDQALANWLAGHRYTEGLAAYWQANATTVTSGGTVLVAPITAQATSVRRWEASASWYDPSRRNVNFVIAVADTSASPGGLSTAAVRRQFGRPARQYLVGQNVIMVYDYNLLTRLGGRGLPGPHQRASPGGSGRRLAGHHQELLAEQSPQHRHPEVCPRQQGRRRQQAAERVRQEPRCHLRDVEPGGVHVFREPDMGQDHRVVGAVEVVLGAIPEVGAHDRYPATRPHHVEQLAEHGGDRPLVR